MQTLIDPFELASRTLPVPPPPPVSEPEIAAAPTKSEPPAPERAKGRSPDSSGRLRCWCSE